MYYTFFMGWEKVATIGYFLYAGVLVAYFGIGTMTQVNSITGSLQASFGTAQKWLVANSHLSGFDYHLWWDSLDFKVSRKKWFLLWLLPVSLRLSRSLPCIWTN